MLYIENTKINQKKNKKSERKIKETKSTFHGLDKVGIKNQTLSCIYSVIDNAYLISKLYSSLLWIVLTTF